MKLRPQLRKFGAGTAAATLLSAAAIVQSASVATAAQPPVTIGVVQGLFFANPTPNSGVFDPSVLLGPPAFTQQFPVIGFNSPAIAQSCSNVTNVNPYSRPFTDVVPNPDGTCSLVLAMGNGLQAGLGTLDAFESVFTANLNVSAAGHVTFSVFSDDGFVLGIGPQGTNQPTYVSGALFQPPASGKSYLNGYSVVGAFNVSTAPNPNDVVVDFPAAGTYPLELDYNECCGGLLALTLAVSGTIVPPLPPPSTHSTSITYTGDASSDFNDAAHLSATLFDTSVSPAAPVADRALTLSLGAQACTGTTDSTGMASCTVTPSVAAGSTTVKANFAGDAAFQSSSAAAPFAVTLEEAGQTYAGPVNFASGNQGTLSGTLIEDGSAPIAGRSVAFTLGSGPMAQICSAITDATGTASCAIGSVAQPLGPGSITASFTSDGFYGSATATSSSLVYAALDSGAFAIGDNSASLGATVNFWGARWADNNSLSGGPAPRSLKGFADTLATTPATCGSSWSTDTGNSSGPPAAVPSFMAVVVTGLAVQSGSVISGTVSEIVVVSTDPGYLDDPGNPGTGTIVAILCRN